MHTVKRFSKRATAFTLIMALFLSLQLPTYAFFSNYEFDVAKGLVNDFYVGEAESKYASPLQYPKDFDVQKTLALVSSVIPYKIEFYQSTTNGINTFSLRYKEDYQQSILKEHARQAAASVVKDTMNNIEKVKAIHDYIVTKTVYTLPTELKTEKNTDLVYSSAGPLIYGTAVCDGYSRAFYLMCESQHIPVMYIGSDNMNHSWNAVYLENQWWLVDVTWDDDGTSEVKYTYFLSKDSLPEHKFDDGTVGTLDFADHLKMANWYYFERKPELVVDEPKLSEGNVKLAQVSNMSQVDLAGKLYLLGKFSGTDLGYELERVPNRVEAATMFSRMNGWDLYIKHEIDKFKAMCPFNDVPEWAAATLGVLYNEKLVAGITPTTFGSYNSAGARDYVTMLLRSMHYVENVDFTWEHALDKARELELIEANAFLDPNEIFTRGDMVEMTARALFVKMADKDNSFGFHLSMRGIISKDFEQIIGIQA